MRLDQDQTCDLAGQEMCFNAHGFAVAGPIAVVNATDRWIDNVQELKGKP
jgi:hypothetical protein